MGDVKQGNSTSPPAASPWALAGLVVVALDLLGLYLYLGRREYLQNPVWVYLLLYAVGFALYAYAAGRLLPRLPRAQTRLALILIVAFGILFRFAVLPARPSLSTDIYLYVWNGRLIHHGINPYRWAPNAQALGALRDPIWERMEYKSYQSIYMPVSQAAFAAGYVLFGDNLTGYKLLFTLFDIGVMGLLLLLLQQLARPPTQLIWYAWCPLPITEISLAGHQDVVGLFFLLLAFFWIRKPKTRGAAAVALVAAGLTKGFALLLLPLFCRTYGRRFTAIAVAALLYLGMPLWVYLPEFLHGMNQYLNGVHVNAGLFHGINRTLLPLTRFHYWITSKLSDIAILAVTAWAAWRPVTSFADLLRRSFFVLAVTLLVVPTLFPWYLVWALPFVVLLGRRPVWSFVLLTGLAAFLYTYYISMQPYWWTPIAEYGPFYALLFWEFRHWRDPEALQPGDRALSRPGQAFRPESSLHTPYPAQTTSEA